MQIVNFLKEKSFFSSKKVVSLIGLFSLGAAVGCYMWQLDSAGDVHSQAAANSANKARAMGSFLHMPLTFEVNQGQSAKEVQYLSHGHGYNTFFTKDEVVFAFADSAIRAQFVNANPQTEIAGVDKLRAKTNYFIGNDRTKWQSGVANYEKVNYKNLYPGIDAVFYGNQQQFEYDIHVAPNANPAAFKLNFQGIKSESIDKDGNLVLQTAKGKTLNMHKPVMYQNINGTKQNVAGDFVLLANNQIGFKVGNYDKSKELVIDPILSLYYSTYLGGSDNYSLGSGVTVDNNGIVYVVGYTGANNFPTKNQYQAYPNNGVINVFLTKFDPTKTDADTLIYSTYLGGSGDSPQSSYGYAIALDSQNCPWIAGYTYSTDFPVTDNAYKHNYTGSGETPFVTKFKADGSDLLYSTYFGTDDASVSQGFDIAVDSSDKAYVVGYTEATGTTFPTKNAYQNTNNGSQAGFLAKFDSTQTTGADTLVYSTLLGSTIAGSSYSHIHAVAVDSSERVFITGETNSHSFPTVKASQTNCYGASAAFITIFPAYSGSGNLPAPIYSSYFGTDSSSQDSADTTGFAIAVDGNSNAYITGYTFSHNLYHVAHGYQTTLNGYAAAFVARITLPRDLVYSFGIQYATYLGSTVSDNSYTLGYDIAVDSVGSVYVVGSTNSNNFPVVRAYQTSHAGGSNDAFVVKFYPALYSCPGLVYSTYLGGSEDDNGYGIAVDKTGMLAYVVGDTSSSNFPTTSNAFSTTPFNGDDAFVSVLQEESNLSWQKNTIKSSLETGNKQVDVFDITLNYDYGCGTTGYNSDTCLWASARHESNSQFARPYVGNGSINPTQTWYGCTLPVGKNYSAGRFGETFSEDVNAYLPTTTGMQLLQYDSSAVPPTSCSVGQYANASQSDDVVGFTLWSSDGSAQQYAYYSKWNLNASPAKNDEVEVSPDNGGTWTTVDPDPLRTDLRINALSKYSFNFTEMTPMENTSSAILATSNGLYFCALPDTPGCTTWTHMDSASGYNFPEPTANVNKVKTVSNYEVVASTYPNDGSGAGLYISDDNGKTWSDKITPPEAAANGVTYISGFDIDNNYDLYVTWYGTLAGSAGSKQPATASFLRDFTAEGLMAGSCSPTRSGVTSATTIVGGVSVGRVYFDKNGKPYVQFYQNGFYHGTDNFFSNSVLGLTLLLDDNYIMQRIYAPSLGGACDTGGYSVGSSG